MRQVIRIEFRHHYAPARELLDGLRAALILGALLLSLTGLIDERGVVWLVAPWLAVWSLRWGMDIVAVARGWPAPPRSHLFRGVLTLPFTGLRATRGLNLLAIILDGVILLWLCQIFFRLPALQVW